MKFRDILLASAAQGGGLAPTPTPIIISSDIAKDVDDSLMMAIACAAQQQGRANILACVASSANLYSASTLKAMLVAAGLPSVPVGTYTGSIPVGASGSAYAAGISNDFRSAEDRTAYSDDVTVMRTALAAAADASVVGICTGFSTNWDNLLASSADGISGLTGAQLIAAKMSKLHLMGMSLPSGSGDFNMSGNPTASAHLFANWPASVPIYITNGPQGSSTSAGMVGAQTSPFNRSFSLIGVTTRQLWDPITIDAAIYGLHGNYSVAGANGTVTYNSADDTYSWASGGTSGTQNYLQNVASAATINADIQAKVDALVVSNPTSIPAWVQSGAILDFDYQNNRYYGDIQSVTLLCTRNLIAYAENAAGLLLPFAVNVARLTDKGLLQEQAATNVALWSRDLTNAAWTASNVTVAKDQTGADGAANGACSITATSANGTVLQSITLASAARLQSAYVKRLVGSGTLEMTTNNGTNWDAVTVTAGYTQLSIPARTLANPTIGFRIGTSGDSFAIDFVQNEVSNSAVPSSPIPTTTVAVTRPLDNLRYGGGSFFNQKFQTAGTFFYQTNKANFAVNTVLFGVDTATSSFVRSASSSPTVNSTSYANSVALTATAGSGNLRTGRAKYAVSFDATGRSFVVNNGTVVTDAQVIPDRGTVTLAANGWIERVALYQTRLSDVALAALTA